MAFDFGAALTSLGTIKPEMDAARQQALLQLQQKQQFAADQKTQGLQQQQQQSTLDTEAQKRKEWVHQRDYETSTGEKHSIYLTPQGYQDVVDTPARKTPEQQIKEAEAIFGVGKVPDWFKNQATAKFEGLNAPVERPQLKPYKLPDGSIQYFDASRPDLIPEGVTAYEAAANKPQTPDLRYLAVQQKKALGQPLDADDTAFETAYKQLIQTKTTDPRVAGYDALSKSRVVQTIDPSDNESLTYSSAGDAERKGLKAPGSIAYQTDKALTRAFTSGQPAQTINYFNTATEHLKQLQQAADALNNGDLQLFNKYGNAWATETGNPAPTNFATIRNAVAGELSKTFKGAAATDAEIDAINTSINSSQSPAQLSGAIGNNIRLMGSKMDALRGQYEQGKQGKPNFPTETPKGSVSLARARTLPQFKGKTDAQIEAAAKLLGYEVKP